MDILVTGATGFLGSNLAAALVEQGHQVRILRRATSRLDALTGIDVEHCIGDIEDRESIDKAVAGCELIFHTAAISQYWLNDTATTYRVNVEGTRNVLDAARRAGVRRVVHTSSVAALGYGRRGTLLDETHDLPETQYWWPYAHSKHLAEQVVLETVAQGQEAVIVNPTIIVGPRDINFVSGSIITASLRGQLRIAPPGGANFVHVDDVVAGHLAAAQAGRPGERYILGCENLTYWDMAKVAHDVTGGPGPILLLPRFSLAPLAWSVDLFNKFRKGPPVMTGERMQLSGETFYFSVDKARTQLSLPQTPFRQALKDAYDWYREHNFL